MSNRQRSFSPDLRPGQHGRRRKNGRRCEGLTRTLFLLFFTSSASSSSPPLVSLSLSVRKDILVCLSLPLGISFPVPVLRQLTNAVFSLPVPLHLLLLLSVIRPSVRASLPRLLVGPQVRVVYLLICLARSISVTVSLFICLPSLSVCLSACFSLSSFYLLVLFVFPSVCLFFFLVDLSFSSLSAPFSFLSLVFLSPRAQEESEQKTRPVGPSLLSFFKMAPREHARLLKELADIEQQQKAQGAWGGKGGGEQEGRGGGSRGSTGGNSGSVVFARILDEDLHHWEGFIEGPSGTPYEGGRFKLDILIPPDYPYNPPKIKFVTKIWHPNISSQTGRPSPRIAMRCTYTRTSVCTPHTSAGGGGGEGGGGVGWMRARVFALHAST